MILRLLPVIVAFLLLAAHFLRSGQHWLVLLCGLTPLLLLPKRRAGWLLVQAAAYVGAAVWLHTTVILVQQRLFWGLPWGRTAAILGIVTLFTAWAGYLLNSPVVKQKYWDRRVE